MGLGDVVVAALEISHRLDGDAPVAALGFPCHQFTFFDQRLNRAHGQVLHLGGVTGATIFTAGIKSDFVTHDLSFGGNLKLRIYFRLPKLEPVYRIIQNDYD